MLKSSAFGLLCVAALLSFGFEAVAQEQLPAWETREEKLQRKVRVPRIWSEGDGLLPPPPAPGYRAPAEFEPVSAFIVSQGDWGASAMLVAMVKGGTRQRGARAVVLTKNDVATFEDTLLSKGVDVALTSVVSPPKGLDAKWARDYGPISIYESGPNEADGPLAFVDLHYYDVRASDDLVTQYLAEQIGLTRYGLEGQDQKPPDAKMLLMEGGNFQTDGQGTCILSNDIPADNKGNPDADTYEEVEAILSAYLGCYKIIWLTPPPETGTGHVDMYSKLLSPTDILVIDFPDGDGVKGAADAAVDLIAGILENETNLKGEPFNVHRLTVPPVRVTGFGQLKFWTYMTYTNSVLLNHVALVPTYNQGEYDTGALETYEEVLGPQWEVIGIPSGGIVDQGGAVHCTTMQIASVCGNGKLDPIIEDCEGEDLGGKSCEELGRDPGSPGLSCTADCRYDLSGCGAIVEPDTGSDTPSDTGSDTGSDTPSDTGSDTPSDTGSDTPSDTGSDSSMDSTSGEGEGEGESEGNGDAETSTDDDDDEPTGDGSGCGCTSVGHAQSAPNGLLSMLLALGF